MRKSLTSIGSDLALILDPPMRDALKLDPNQQVEVEVDGDSLVVRGSKGRDPDPIGDAFQRVVENPAAIKQGKANPHGVAESENHDW